MERIGALWRSAKRRQWVPSHAILCAALLMSLLLITEFEIVRLWREADTLQWWLRVAQMLFLTGLLGFGVAAIAACRSNKRARNLEPRLRSQTMVEASSDQGLEDPLTELPNGCAIIANLREAIERSEGASLAFYLLDLNGLKSANNTYGRATGDAILRVVALRLLSVARGGDLIAQFGSDAFAVLARDVGSRREAIDIGQRYVAALDGAINIENRAHAIGATLGLAFYPDDGATTEELIDHADFEMRSERASRQSEMQFFVALTNAPAA